jgi:hypothetical protein
MDLTNSQKDEVEKIMASMDCPSDFRCYKSGFEKMCKAEYHGLDDFANCLEGTATRCNFKMPFGFGVFCTCALRVYIARKLGK